MKINKFLIFGSIILTSACFILQAQAATTVSQADLAPLIQLPEAHITKISGNTIEGEFSVINGEKYYLSDLNYEIKLLQGTSFDNYKLIDVVVPSGTFFVAPDDTISKNFTYTYPKNITNGNYAVRIEAMTSRGTELGWYDLVTPLTGENKFLNIIVDSSKVAVDNNANVFNKTGSTSTNATSTSVDGKIKPPVNPPVISSVVHKIATPLEGINVSSTDDVSAYLQIKNTGKAITVVPQIKIYKRQINMPVVKEYNDTAITFAKGETKTITLKMPKLDIPESYLAEVKFFENNQQVSGLQYFRWVVEGDSGKIIYIKADKDFYKAGDTINLTVQPIGPADGSNGGQGQLEITVSDKNGKLISKTSEAVSLGDGLVTSLISIPVKADLVSPIIDVKLTKASKILDEQKITLPVFSAQAKQIEKQANQKTFQFYLIVGLLALAIIVVAWFVFYKLKKLANKNK